MGFADSNLRPAKTKNTVGCLFEENMCIRNKAKSAVGHNSQFFGLWIRTRKMCACTLSGRKKNRTRSDDPDQIWFPGSQEFLGGSKERCSFL